LLIMPHVTGDPIGLSARLAPSRGRVTHSTPRA